MIVQHSFLGNVQGVDEVRREKEPGQYARELDAQLRRLAAMHNQTRYLIGVALSILRDRNAFQPMGYRSMACFSVQELGMQAGQALEVARIAKELRHRPATLLHHLSGQISYGVLRIMLSGTPRLWEDQTCAYFVGRTVSEAEDFVALFRREYDKALAERMAARGGDDKKPEPRKKRKPKAPVEKPDPRLVDLARRAAEAGVPVGGDGSFSSEPEEDGHMVELDASPGLAAKYFVGTELARRLEGADLPVHACFEIWSAEMISGPGADALQAAVRENPDAFRPAAPEASDDVTKPVPDPVRQARNLERALDRAFWKDVEREIHQFNGHWSFLDWTLPRIEKLDHLAPEDQMTLDELCTRLRALREIDGRTNQLLREGLYRFQRARYHLDLEFVNVGHYGEARLNMSRSAARFLVTLERRLRGFPHIRAALDAGTIKENQASLLVTIATPESEQAWIAHAQQTTVRFLRDDIREAECMRVFDAPRFERTHGIPSRRRIRMRGASPTSHEHEMSGKGPAGGQTCAADSGCDHDHPSPTRPSNAGAHATAKTGQTCADDPTEMTGQSCAGDPTSAAGQTCAGDPATRGTDSQKASKQSHRRPSRTPLPVPEFRKRLQQVVDDVNGSYDEDPFQGARVRLKLWIPSSLEPFFQDVMQTANLVLGGWGGFHAALELCLDAFLSQYGEETLRELGRHPILSRDGCRCAVPTCGRRGTLHVHHIQFRSNGGSNAPFNLITLCEAHHLQGVHQGYIRITGLAPDDILWELGMKPDGTCWMKVEGRTIVERDEGLSRAA